MPHWLSSRSSTASATLGSVKLGQPEPESTFVSAWKRAVPHAAHRYVPSWWSSQYLPVNARSVAPLRSTSYCSGVSSARHCSSVFSILVAIASPPIAFPKGYDARRACPRPPVGSPGRSGESGHDIADDRFRELVGEGRVAVQHAVVEGAVGEVEGGLDVGAGGDLVTFDRAGEDEAALVATWLDEALAVGRGEVRVAVGPAEQ